MEIVMIAAIAGQAVNTIQAGRAQAQGMKLQARQAELQGRQNALAYNRQALQVFERQERLASTVRARAAAAGVDPFTGSPMTLQQANALAAGREMQIAQENAQMAIYGGLAQSQSLQAAAKFVRNQAITSAVTTAALQGYQMSRTATPNTQAPAPVVDRSVYPASPDGRWMARPPVTATTFPVGQY